MSLNPLAPFPISVPVLPPKPCPRPAVMLALANAIFELLYPNLKTQAVFTVPTRVVTTGSGTEPSSSTVAPARDANPKSNDREIHAS
jgi:hypothetical protein